MFIIDGKECSDKVVAQGYWKAVKERMAGCKQLATEYCDSHEKRKSYRFSYVCDPGTMSCYVDFKDDDLQLILNEYEEYRKIVEAENETINDEWALDFDKDRLGNLDIDWSLYIPEDDQHWGGGPAEPVNVDLDDYQILYNFDLQFYHKESETPQTYNLQRELTREQYIQLLTLKLFDPQLDVNDLKWIDEELYQIITQDVYRPHHQHVIFLSEIEACASVIRESDEYKQLKTLVDHPFASFVHDYILSHSEEFGSDQQLFLAFRIATEG